MFVIEWWCSVADINHTWVSKLTIEYQNKILIVNPIVFPHETELLILPLHKIAIVFTFLHLISLQFYQIFDLLHGIPYIIGFRNVHTESKCPQRLTRLDCYLIFTRKTSSFNPNLNRSALLLKQLEIDRWFWLRVKIFDEAWVWVLDSDVAEPIGGSWIHLSFLISLHMNLLFPPVSEHLVFDISFQPKRCVCDLLVRVFRAIVAEHVDV